VPGLKAEKGEKGSVGKRGRAVSYYFISLVFIIILLYRNHFSLFSLITLLLLFSLHFQCLSETSKLVCQFSCAHLDSLFHQGAAVQKDSLHARMQVKTD